MAFSLIFNKLSSFGKWVYFERKEFASEKNLSLKSTNKGDKAIFDRVTSLQEYLFRLKLNVMGLGAFRYIVIFRKAL